MEKQHPKYTILMPCLNEELTLEACIKEAQTACPEAEILIADNGSTDKSIEIAESLGARIAHIKEKGYGNALIGGLLAARGEYVVMADSDMSYSFQEAPAIFKELEAGNSLVMGNRFRGGITPGAMPFLHKYLGNPVLSLLGRVLFNLPIGDFHCGIRGVKRADFVKIDYLSTGMEWASEMVLRAGGLGYNISEVPATLRKDGRDRPPHLRTWRDGWRHLKILLLFSPTWLFTIPGTIMTTVGILATILLLIGPVTVHSTLLDVHTLVYTSCLILLGTQTIYLGKFSEEFGIIHGMHPNRSGGKIPMEWGVIGGVTLLGFGILLGVGEVVTWATQHFAGLNPQKALRVVIPSALLMTLGSQTIFSSFMIGLTALLEKKRKNVTS
jgi:glycosyltransferase involved in cell wall biosynthesis